MKKIRVGALISGRGTNLRAIIDRCEDGFIPAEVVVVGSDNPGAKGLKRASEYNIANFHVSPKGLRFDTVNQYIRENRINIYPVIKKMGYTSGMLNKDKLQKIYQRVHHEAEVLAMLEDLKIDLLVLAGYMRLLTPYFIDEFNQGKDKIMNIHPALLPAFPGTDGYGNTFHYGCKTGGCTVHFVDYGEDTGPIIGQRTFPITSSDTLEDIKKKRLKRGMEALSRMYQAFCGRPLGFS